MAPWKRKIILKFFILFFFWREDFDKVISLRFRLKPDNVPIFNVRCFY